MFVSNEIHLNLWRNICNLLFQLHFTKGMSTLNKWFYSLHIMKQHFQFQTNHVKLIDYYILLTQTQMYGVLSFHRSGDPMNFPRDMMKVTLFFSKCNLLPSQFSDPTFSAFGVTTEFCTHFYKQINFGIFSGNDMSTRETCYCEPISKGCGFEWQNESDIFFCKFP